MPKKRNKNVSKAPLKNYSAFIFFLKSCKEELFRKEPEEKPSAADLTKLCTSRWKAMTESEKKKYYQLAEYDKKRYKAEMATYHCRQTFGKSISKRKLKDPNAPKRFMTAHNIFIKEESVKIKTERPDLSFVALSRETNKRWTELDSVSKAKFEKLAEETMLRYKSEKKVYDENIKNTGGIIIEDSDSE